MMLVPAVSARKEPNKPFKHGRSAEQKNTTDILASHYFFLYRRHQDIKLKNMKVHHDKTYRQAAL